MLSVIDVFAPYNSFAGRSGSATGRPRKGLEVEGLRVGTCISAVMGMHGHYLFHVTSYELYYKLRVMSYKLRVARHDIQA